MATGMYLEQYLDSLEVLPSDLQRNFNLMRDLDHRTQDCLKSIDTVADGYARHVRQLTHQLQKERLQAVDALFVKTIGFSDDKVNLANQTYEMVDKHIRRLDTDLARFDSDLKEKVRSEHGENGEAQHVENEKKKSKKKLVEEEVEEEVPKKKGKKKAEKGKPLQDVSQVSNAMAPLAALGAPADVLDMPVDPNEPTYCLCHQVSYGEMIGCDNPECLIEWFHFPCVHLTSKPKGKWFCPRCVGDKNRVR